MPLKELTEVKLLLRGLKRQLDQESLSSFSEQLSSVVEALGQSEVAKFLRDIGSKLGTPLIHESNDVSRHEFFHWLNALLERRDVGFASSKEADAIELVSVKQL